MFTGRKAAFSIRALNRMTVLAGTGYVFSNNHAEAQRLRENVATYKEESEKVCVSFLLDCALLTMFRLLSGKNGGRVHYSST